MHDNVENNYKTRQCYNCIHWDPCKKKTWDSINIPTKSMCKITMRTTEASHSCTDHSYTDYALKRAKALSLVKAALKYEKEDVAEAIVLLIPELKVVRPIRPLESPEELF